MAITTMTDPPGDSALFDLMSWMSPAWPIGAFAHSSGLEWAVEQGFVIDRASTTRWLTTLLDHGPIHNDVVVFVQAWRAACTNDGERLREVAELAVAAQTGFERRLEATAQGAAFRRIAMASLEQDGPADRPRRSPDPSSLSLSKGRPSLEPSDQPEEQGQPFDKLREDGCLEREMQEADGLDKSFRALLAPIPDADLTYPVAAATLFATQAIALRHALTAYLHGAIANLVSAAQRLVPLGQTDAQRVLRDLRPAILAASKSACDLSTGDPFDAFAGAALLAELGCMAHETQYTRLFRT